MEVLAKGSTFYESDINLITRASLTPVSNPSVVWRIPSAFNNGPWFDLTLRGAPNGVAVLYFSPSKFSRGLSLPGIAGLLHLSQPALALVSSLDAQGTATIQPSAAAYTAITQSWMTPSYWQVIDVASGKLRLGSPNTLVAH